MLSIKILINFCYDKLAFISTNNQPYNQGSRAMALFLRGGIGEIFLQEDEGKNTEAEGKCDGKKAKCRKSKR